MVYRIYTESRGMQSPWGEIDVDDAHVHFFSHGFFSALAAQKSAQTAGAPYAATPDDIAAALGWQAPPPDPQALAAIWIKELDRRGVRRAALIASIPGDQHSVAAAVGAYPDRFYGYFMVNPVAGDAAKRVRTALDGGHLHGICLFPAMHCFSIQDERIRPVLEAAARRPGATVFVHCGVLTVGVRAKLGLPSPFDMRFSNPVDLHAIALAFPKLRFVIPHFGAGYFREAMMVCDLCPNVYLDTSSSNHWTRYQAEPMELRQVFRRALDVAGPERLLFGSDSSFFPRGWHAAIFEAQAQTLREIGISAGDARRIFGSNLEKLLSE
jgi:predicted TIM-barrel fold metal-dependent hydrolase